MTRSVGQHKMDFMFFCVLFVLFCYFYLVGILFVFISFGVYFCFVVVIVLRKEKRGA